MINKHLSANITTAELVSVQDFILNGDANLVDNYNTLKSRTANQSATPGTTTFTGLITATSFPALTLVNVETSSFNTLSPISTLTFTGSLGSTGTITATQLTTNMTGSTAVGCSLVAPSSSTSTIGFLWGRATSTNNSAVYQWDANNTRCVLSLASNFTSQWRLSQTEVNVIANTIQTETGLYYNPIRNNTTGTFNFSGTSTSSTLTVPANTRLVYIHIWDFTSTAGDVLLQMQVGQGSVWNTSSPANQYNGVIVGGTGASDVIAWQSDSAFVTKQNSSIRTYLINIQLTYVGIGADGYEVWSMRSQCCDTVTAGGYSAESAGTLIMKTPSATTLTSIRFRTFVGAGGTKTGSYELSYG
jgi:hypothetical protein